MRKLMFSAEDQSYVLYTVQVINRDLLALLEVKGNVDAFKWRLEIINNSIAELQGWASGKAA